MYYRRRWPRFLAFFLIIGPLAIFIFGTVVQWLWNNVLATIVNVHTVTFWQALGILVLSKILFTGFMGGGSRRYYQRRMMRDWDKLSPEEKEKFRQDWRDRCGPWGERSWRSDSSTPQTETQI